MREVKTNMFVMYVVFVLYSGSIAFYETYTYVFISSDDIITRFTLTFGLLLFLTLE